MRRHSKISGMTLVTCDALGCVPNVDAGTEFRSCSDPRLVGDQLKDAGWTELEVADLKGNKQRHDLCPQHRPLGRMSGGPPPLATKGKTSSH